MNFFTEYHRTAGLSETYPGYHRLAALSLVAACLSHRVWLQLERFRPLHPNLYVLLLGEPASGKGQALSHALGILKPYREDVAIFEGSVTAPALVDHLASATFCRDGSGCSEMFFVSSELADSLGQSETASAFVKRLTMLFTGDLEQFHHSTRANGDVQVEKAVLNCLICSTQEWLLTNLKVEDVRGGFMSRCLVALCPEPWPPERIFQPTWPSDGPRALGQLQDSVGRLLSMQGEISLTPGALARVTQWYEGFERFPDKDQRAAWARVKELVLKVAMLHVAGTRFGYQIGEHDIAWAIELVTGLKREEQALISWITGDKKQSSVQKIVQTTLLSSDGPVDWSHLLRRVGSKGISAQALRECLNYLEQIGDIESGSSVRNGKTIMIFRKKVPS